MRPSALLTPDPDERPGFGGVPSFLFDDLSAAHTHVIGRSGVGKTKFLERIVRHLIHRGCAVVVLDFKGYLYTDLVQFCSEVHMRPQRLTLFDPTAPAVPGLNVLERVAPVDASTHAELVLDMLKKMFGDTEPLPWLHKYGLATLAPLIAAGGVLPDVIPFITNRAVRRAVLDQANLPTYAATWAAFDQLPLREQQERLDVVGTRCEPFYHSPLLRAIFGQPRSTLDWRAVLNGAGVVLAQLGHGQVGPRALSFIGTALVHQLVSVAQTRSAREAKQKPVFVVLDEFQRALTPDIADALDTLRGFGIYFLLAHQALAQLAERDRLVYHSVMANARNKVVFGCAWSDAELLLGEVFPDELVGGTQLVKDEISQTKFRPVESRRLVETDSDSTTLSLSGGLTVTNGLTRSTTKTRAVTDAVSEGEYDGTTWNEAETTGTADSVTDSDEHGTPRSTRTTGSHSAHSSSVGDASGSSRGTSHTVTEGDAHGEATTNTTGFSFGGSFATTRGSSRSFVPFTEQHAFSEPSSRAYYPDAEVRTALTAQLSNQPSRWFVLKRPARPPVPGFVPDLYPARAWLPSLERFRKAVYAVSCRLIEAVSRELHARHFALAATPSPPDDPPTSQPSRRRRS